MYVPKFVCVYISVSVCEDVGLSVCDVCQSVAISEAGVVLPHQCRQQATSDTDRQNIPSPQRTQENTNHPRDEVKPLTQM